MRNHFSGFYGISEDAIETVFTSENTTFIFDTNILLTLYRCEEETRNRFFEIWENIKEKCWFPHQVCLEYQRNRLKVVNDSRSDLKKIPNKMTNVISELKTAILGTEFNNTISRYTNLKGEIELVFSGLENIINTFRQDHIEPRKENINFIKKHDIIRDSIDRLTDGRIGDAPSNQEDIDKLNKIGKIRYDHKIGPGYEDLADKKDKFYSYNGINYSAMYGDFYVWSQVLDYIKINQGKNIVYVTNDAKSDFFYKVAGQIRGPNESLTTEIKNAGAREFLLQSIDTFLHHANSYLNAEVEESVIKELTNASDREESYELKSWSIKNYQAREYKKNLNSLLSINVSIDTLYKLHTELVANIEEASKKIKEIQSIDIHQLASVERLMLISKRLCIEESLSIYNELLEKVKSRMNVINANDAAAQLR